MRRSLLILREGEIRELLDMQECIEAVERAFAAYSTGHGSTCQGASSSPGGAC